MAKKKEELDEVTKTTENEVTAPIVSEPVEMNAVLYKYNVGDTVYTMQDNKVKSFVIGKRIVVSRLSENGIVNEVLYDESNWDSLKAQYKESSLFATKKELLNSL